MRVLEESWTRLDRWLVLLIAIAALALRLYDLGRESLWLDEIGQVLIARNPWWLTILRSAQHNGNTPLSYVITHFTFYYAGQSEAILRTPAVIWGVLSVVLVFELGRTMFDKLTGYSAACLLAIVPLHVYFSREVRFYSLATFLTLASVYTFWRAVNENSRKSWILYGLVHLLALYAHYYVVVVTVIQGVWPLWTIYTKRYARSTFGGFIRASGVAVLLFVPWVLHDAHYEQVHKAGLLSGGFDFVCPSLTRVLASMFFLHGSSLSFENADLWWACLAWGIVLIGGLAVPIRCHSGLQFELRGSVLLCLLVLVGVSSVLTLDAVGSYFFSPRQFLIFTPLILLVVSAGALNVFRVVYSRVGGTRALPSAECIATIALVGLSLFALWKPLANVYDRHREDWRGTGRYLIGEIGTNDIILTANRPHLEFYAPEIASAIEQLRDVSSVQQAAESHSRVWVSGIDGLLRRRYADVYRWVNQEELLEVSCDPQLKLFLYSAAMSPSQLVEEFVKSRRFTPSMLLFSEFATRAIREGYVDEIADDVLRVAKDEAVDAGDRVGMCVRVGRALSDVHEHARAVEILTQATSLDPSDADAWTTLGIAHNRRGEPMDAVSAYREALECDPNKYWANHLLATTLSWQGQWEEVVRLEQRAVELAYREDIRAGSLTLLAKAYAQLGRVDSACEAFRRAYEISESDDLISEMDLLGCSDEP